MNPLVSVIVPAFNAEPFIEETLNSILSQTYKNIEIIVVDDGSTDRTAELVRAYGDRVQYIWQANSGGCSSPRNRGAIAASGEFLTFFDADDVMVASKIEFQVQALQMNKMLGFSISTYANFRGNEVEPDHFSTCAELSKKFKEGGVTLIMNSAESTHLLLLENFTSACGPLFRSDAFFLAGGFDESLKACEDFHLIYRIAMQHPIAVIDVVGFRRRVHGNNMSANSEKMLLNYIKSRSSLLEMETRNQQVRLLGNRVRGYALELSNFYILEGLPNEACDSLRAGFSIGQITYGVLVWQLKTVIKLGLLRLYLLPKARRTKTVN